MRRLAIISVTAVLAIAVTALQEQLGLKLESTRGPADIHIIDRVERPTDN